MGQVEMLQKIREKVESYLEMLKKMKAEIQDHVTGLGVNIEDIKKYDPNGFSTYGAYIDSLYKNHVTIITPLTPVYSMWDTPVNTYDVLYEKLSDKDVESLYKHLYKE